MAKTKVDSTPVLIVGGSLVGLSTAICLAAQDIKTIVVERHKGSSSHPRALGFTPRTMEIYRALGFQHKIKEADPDFKLLRARVESLAGEWYQTLPWTENQEAANPLDYSISPGAAIAQDELEEVLRSEAHRHNVDLRYSNTLTAFEQSEKDITATVKSPDGEEYQIRASYMIAADGNQSHVRQTLGIQREGEQSGLGKMGTISSVMFRADLGEYLERGVTQFNIDQPELKAFMTHYLDGRWALMFRDGLERTTEELETAIYRAIGRKDIPFEILTTGRWDLSMLIADKFMKGRVLLAGDAAHTLPPNRGGYGANTGIADAWNLSWKIAAVLSGTSHPDLLDTYELERREIALLRKQQILLRADYKMYAKTEPVHGEVIDDVAMEFGELYRSGAVMTISPDLPAARRPDEWKGQPGTRAPLFWMIRDGKRVPSLDLFSKTWVLIAESRDWIDAASEVARNSSVKIRPLHVGVGLHAEDLSKYRDAIGISEFGASLIRPDGIVAWRGEQISEEPRAALEAIIQQVVRATHI